MRCAVGTDDACQGWLAAAPAGSRAPGDSHQGQCDVDRYRCIQDHGGLRGARNDTFKVFFDRFGNVSIRDVSHVVSTLTNRQRQGGVRPATRTGDAFTPRRSGQRRQRFTSTDTLTGMPMRIYTWHSDTLVKDVGGSSHVTTFDAQGNLLPAGGRASAARLAPTNGDVQHDRVRDRAVRRLAGGRRSPSFPATRARCSPCAIGLRCLGPWPRSISRRGSADDLGCVPVPRPP